MDETERLDVPLPLLVPAKLSKQASGPSCGLFFPYAARLPIGLAVDWDGETHLIHLAGEYLFRETGIDVGQSIRGAVINDIEYRVDVTSLYDSVEKQDPAGALVIKAGELYLYCSRLGDRIHYDPHPVPLGKGYMLGATDQACGFKRWSIAVRDGDKSRVMRSFEAAPDM